MRIVSFTLTFCFCASLFGQGISFFEGSFDEAKELAAKEGKLIFMDSYAKWCGPCKRMARDVFTVEEVGDFFNANFVNLKMDMETEEGRMLNKTYQVAVYPTLFVLDADGEIILREKGYRDARGLLQVGRKALLPSESEMLDMADQFQSGQYDVLFLVDYLQALQWTGKEGQSNVMAKLAESISPSDMQLEKVQQAFLGYNPVASGYYPTQILKDYQNVFIGRVGKEDFEETVLSILKGLWYGATKEEYGRFMTPEDFDSYYDVFKSINSKRYKSEVYLWKMAFSEAFGDWDTYLKSANAFFKSKAGKTDATTIMSASWTLYHLGPGYDNQVLAWTDRVMESTPNSGAPYFLQAYLFMRQENYEKADDVMKRCMAFLTQDSPGYKDASIINAILETQLSR